MIIFGGWSAKTKAPTNDIFVWDCEKQLWSGAVETAGTPPSPRLNHTAVIHRDRMIVFGGHNEVDKDADVHILNLLNRQPTWSGPITAHGQVPRPVSNHSACMHGDKMLVFGDNGESSAVFSLDLAVSKLIWKHVEAKGEIPQARLSHTATMVANHMVLLGGERLCSDPRQSPFANDNSILDMSTTPAVWRRLPHEGALPAARHMHTTVFHGPTMCIFMFGGTQTPSAGRKNAGKVKSLLGAKGLSLRGLHILPLGNLVTPTTMALPVDCALSSTMKNMKQVRAQRVWFKDRIPQQFLRLAAFLKEDKSECVTFVEDLNNVVASLEVVTVREAALVALQMRIRASLPRDSPPAADLHGDADSDTLSPRRRSQTLDEEEVKSLVQARDTARAQFLSAAEELCQLVADTALAHKVQNTLVSHLGSLQNILALYDVDDTEDKQSCLISGHDYEGPDGDTVDIRTASFTGAMSQAEEILTTFLESEATYAEELRRKTDSVASKLQEVLLRSIHDFMDTEPEPAPPISDENGFASTETTDTLVRMVENLTAEEDIWFARQQARAEPLIPQTRKVIRQLLRTLRSFEHMAQGVLIKVGLVEKSVASIHEHALQPPKIEEFTALVDEVDLAQRDFCLAFAELDSLRKLRRRDADRIAASEKKVDEVRRALQSVQRKEEDERMKLANILHEHWPEMLLWHGDLKLKEALGEWRAAGVDGFLRGERSLEDYDIQTYNTTGRHVVLQARFEDQEFALKEYVISDLEVLKHEVRVLVRLQHPNVMPCQALVVNENEMKAYLQLPYYTLSMCEWVATGPPLEEARMLTGQVLSALSYLHARGVMHGNVRLENVMLDREAKRAYLADFDISHTASERAVTVATSLVTPNGSVAPEVMAGECGTAAADMWAFGYMLVMVQLRGRKTDKMIPQDLSVIMRNDPFPTQLMDLLDNLFMEDPGRRLTADAALLYRWFGSTGLTSEKERLRRAVAEVQRDREVLRKAAIQLQVDRQSFREIQGQLLERVEALTSRSLDLVGGRNVHINTAQRLIFDLTSDNLNGDLKELANQWTNLAEMSDRLERLSREFAARQREVEWKEKTILQEKERQATVAATSSTSVDAAEDTPNETTIRLFGQPPIYWMGSGIRNMNPLVDVTDTWLSKMQELVTATETTVRHGKGRSIRRQLVVHQVYHVESCAMWASYCNARDVVRTRVAQAVQTGHHTLIMGVGREWMHDLQLDSTINEKLLFCCNPQQLLDRARLGFGVEEKIRCPSKLGYGIYFTDSASQAEAVKEGKQHESSEDLFLVLGRVSLGCPLSSEAVSRDTSKPPDYYDTPEACACAHPSYDSVVHGSEFSIYSGDMCYPEFILRYKVVAQEEIWSLDATADSEGTQQTKKTLPKAALEDHKPFEAPQGLPSPFGKPRSTADAPPPAPASFGDQHRSPALPFLGNGGLPPQKPAPEPDLAHSPPAPKVLSGLTAHKPSLLEKLGSTSFKLGSSFKSQAPAFLRGNLSAGAAPQPPPTPERVPARSPVVDIHKDPEPESKDLTPSSAGSSWPRSSPADRDGPMSELSRAIERRIGGDPEDWRPKRSTGPRIEDLDVEPGTFQMLSAAAQGQRPPAFTPFTLDGDADEDTGNSDAPHEDPDEGTDILDSHDDGAANGAVEQSL